MARYYFRLSNHGSVDDRPEGMDLANLRAAREHAIAVARDLAKNTKPRQMRGVVLAVLDSEGRKLLDFPLANIPQE